MSTKPDEVSQEEWDMLSEVERNAILEDGGFEEKLSPAEIEKLEKLAAEDPSGPAEVPAAAAAASPAAAAPAAAAAPTEAEKELARLQEENLRLQGENATLKTVAPATPAGEPAPAFDVNAKHAEYAKLLVEADYDQASVIFSEILEHTKGQAKAELAEEAVEVEQKTAFATVVSSAIAKYPFLDSTKATKNDDAVEEVTALRDFYLGQGKTAAEALQRAVDKVGPRYAPKGPAVPAAGAARADGKPATPAPAHQTLGDVAPAASSEEDGAIFDKLDSLMEVDGEAYEKALAGMSQGQQRRYLER